MRGHGSAALSLIFLGSAMFLCADCGNWTERSMKLALSGGVVGALDTEHGAGWGPVLHVGAVVHGCADIGATCEEIDCDGTIVRRYSCGVETYGDNSPMILSLGWGYHRDDRSSWGTGPRVTVGLLWVPLDPSDDLVFLAVADAYIWFGSSGGDFDMGFGGSLAGRVGFRF